MGFPAATFEEAVELTITASNQQHQIINGTATEEVQTEDGSYIPTVRKALVDNLYFKSPVEWATGTNETVYNQLRAFPDPTSGQISWWYAPNATNSNPILMPANPSTSPSWVVYGLTSNALYQVQKRLAAEAGYTLVGTFFLGCTLNSSTEVILDEFSGKYYSWDGVFPKIVTAGTNPTGGGFTDRSGQLLRELLSDIENAVRVAYTSSVPTVADLRLLIGSYEGQIVKTQSYRGHNLGGAEYAWRESITPADNSVTVLGSDPAGRWVMRSNGFVYDSQCGVLPTSLDTADQSDYYNTGLTAAPKVVSVYGNKADPINVTNGVLLADKAIVGVKIPFRTTGDTGTRWVSSANDKSQIRFSPFKLGQEVDSIILETTATGIPTRPAIEFNATNEVTTAGIGARIKNTVSKGRWLQGLRIGGTAGVGWSWEVNIDNFQSEGHYSAGIEIGGFSANVSIINSKALLGDIAAGAVAIRVKSGNVRIDNFRSENNTWTLDLVGGHTEFNNLYSEGNRNGDIRSSGGSCAGGFMQAAHTNVGVTTEAVLKVVSGVSTIPVVKVDKIALSVANGNVLTYLDLLESKCYCEADFIWGSGVDTSGVNFSNISAEFNSRYAANRLGFPQYGFELRRREVQGETSWAFTACKTVPRGFFDSAYQFTLPRIDSSGAAATAYNATRIYSTYMTSAQVDYVNTSATPSSPTWVKRSSIQ